MPSLSNVVEAKQLFSSCHYNDLNTLNKMSSDSLFKIKEEAKLFDNGGTTMKLVPKVIIENVAVVSGVDETPLLNQ